MSWQCAAGSIYLGGYNPPRDASFSNFDDRFRDEVRRTRRTHGKLAWRRIHVGPLQAGEIHYTGVRRQRVIELLIGVPGESNGRLFDVVADERREGAPENIERLYRSLIRSFVVVKQ
jgi:hypothetical protein